MKKSRPTTQQLGLNAGALINAAMTQCISTHGFPIAKNEKKKKNC
jgi:hypothetical protein